MHDSCVVVPRACVCIVVSHICKFASDDAFGLSCPRHPDTMWGKLYINNMFIHYHNPCNVASGDIY